MCSYISKLFSLATNRKKTTPIHIVGNSHAIGMIMVRKKKKERKKMLISRGGNASAALPACLPVFGRPAHLNKDWTFSLPIQTKGEGPSGASEQHLGDATGLRSRRAENAPAHRRTRPPDPPERTRRAPVNCPVWRPREGRLSPGSIAARTPCSHDVIPVDSAIRKPAGYERQGTR